MKKLFCLTTTTLLSVVCLAQTNILANSNYSKTGGRIVKPGSKQGVVVLVNTTKSVAQKDVQMTAEYLAENTQVDFRVLQDSSTTTGAEALEKTSANAVLLIVEDIAVPKILVAPDDRWAVVNVAKLKEGLPKNGALFEKMFSYRLRKVVLRTAAQLLGGFQSMFQGNLMSVTSAEEVDQVKEALPADTLGCMTDYLGKIGVKPEVVVSYARAVKEGWAPAPTNDIQKVIWDRIHSLPKNPMKIEFDPKKGR